MIPLRYTRNLFLRAFCIVYLFAFISFYIQIPALYGDNGILPASSVLENSKHKTLSAKVHYQPTLLWLSSYLGLDTNYALDAFSLLGIFLAFTGLISQKFCTIPLFAGLWSLYFSLYQVGQIFVTTNYDEFLLEAGFLAIFVAPLLPGKRRLKGSPTDVISFWLLRFLLFRFLFGSGSAKFLSGCSKWWSLTSFDYHFQSMPLPSPLSWYSHHIPPWCLRLVAIYASVCELILPFLFFVPIRCVRFTVFIFQVFLQICIVLTGNYNFVNLLLVTLLLSLLDDQYFYRRKKSVGNWFIAGKFLNLLIWVAIIFGVVQLYSLKLNGIIVESKIAFTKIQFNQVYDLSVTVILLVGAVTLLGTCLYSLINIFSDQAYGSKVAAVVSTLLYSVIAFGLFVASTVPIATVHPQTNTTINPIQRNVYNRLHKLHLINQYGLFPKMVGVEGRHEIILEGADNVEGPWKEYNFLYKPGNVNHSLPFVAPYTPRLDWQMYWAAYSTYEKESWLLSLTHRLLLGRPEVLALLDKNHSPFTDNPPKFIRAVLYKYKYTSWNQRNQPTWWTRERVGEYFPAYSKDTAALVDFLKARNLLPHIPKQTVNPIFKQILDSIRYATSGFEATLLLWSVFTAGCAIISSTSGKK